MATWNLTATKEDDRVAVIATGPEGQPVVRFECWASHLEGLTAAQRRAHPAGRIRAALAAPEAYATVPATVEA